MQPTLLSLEALETDRQFVERQLKEAAGSAWGTSRLMWDNRLKEIDEQIASLRAKSNSYASVALIFDGLPVIGQGDIRLDFSTDALDSYQKMIAMALAAQQGDALPDRGRVKGAEKARLFIRDLVRGSMGFVLEEIAPEQQELVATPLKHAVEDATSLIRLLSEEPEERFAEALEETQPRLIAAVQKFAKVLHEAGASTRIVGDENRVSLSSEAVARLTEKLNEVEVKDDVERFDGVLLGILPDAHQFELRIEGDHPTMKGAVADDLVTKYLADVQFKEQLLLKPVRASIKFVRTLRNGKLVKEQRILENLEPLAQIGSG
ncbi:hypothetical protein N1F89_09890 [Aquibium sp. A9E412]|uniref:hypothetical protein n=1 Tax=Aquibium sp. A9E412 TaxID=2976767 RepID=UPI0025AFBAED|nr:hypothetical protein [Aquibium sp. A9E412]MDN2566534.1 hypothetical protein [Aquibium sp. A9E412]